MESLILYTTEHNVQQSTYQFYPKEKITKIFSTVTNSHHFFKKSELKGIIKFPKAKFKSLHKHW